MTIQTGDRIPDATLNIMSEEGPANRTTGEIFGGKKVVLFAVPGAFTPTCSNAHLPGFVSKADEIRAKGVDEIVCMAVNDVFVMDAWGKSQNAENILMAADGNGEFTRQLGLELDATGFGMGQRCKRFALVADDGKVELVNVDESGLDKSSAETILQAL